MLLTGLEMQRPGGNAEGRLPGKREKLKFKKLIKTFGEIGKGSCKKRIFTVRFRGFV